MMLSLTIMVLVEKCDANFSSLNQNFKKILFIFTFTVQISLSSIITSMTSPYVKVRSERVHSNLGEQKSQQRLDEVPETIISSSLQIILSSQVSTSAKITEFSHLNMRK